MTTTLGNLYPLIEMIASQNVPALSFLDSKYTDVQTWRVEALSKLMELLRYQPPPVAMDANVSEVTQHDGVIREKLSFNSAPGVRVPAYLLRPARQAMAAPAIVALHDHGGFFTNGKEKLVQIDGESSDLSLHKNTYYSGRSYATELARLGYVVIVIDAFYFGERRIDFDAIDQDLRARLQASVSTLSGSMSAYHEQCSAFEEVVARHIFAAGATWLGIMSHDDRASVDYLMTRPEVDPERIGCLGLSMGGHRNNYLLATEPRIKAAVTVGWMANWKDLLASRVRSHSWAQFVPGLAANFELSDVVSIGMPAALFVQQCARDELFTGEAMQRACMMIERNYAKAGLPERFQSRFYDVPHQFNKTMQQDAFDWLAHWLM